jgi:hypothetical protein
MNKLTTILVVGHVLALASALTWTYHLKRENNRLKQNQALLLKGEQVRMERRHTKDGRNALAIEALTLRVSELSKAGDSLLNVAQVLGIRNRRLEEMMRAAYQTQTPIRTVVRDSVVMLVPGRTDTLPCLSYSDPWLSFSGCLRADSFIGQIHARDTLDIVVHRIPRRFLFFRWGCKAVKMEAVGKNPHTQLTYLKYVRFAK